MQSAGVQARRPLQHDGLHGQMLLAAECGSCKVEDFASELYTRQIESEEVCHKPVSHYENPLCIQLPTTRTDTRVLTHFDATAIAAQTPTPAAPGLAACHSRARRSRRAFIALARREEYTRSGRQVLTPQTAMLRFTGSPKGVRARLSPRESRCVLVSSATSTATTKMYASLEPCTAKLADGVLTVAAAAAPPPPPGVGVALFMTGEIASPTEHQEPCHHHLHPRNNPAIDGRRVLWCRGRGHDSPHHLLQVFRRGWQVSIHLWRGHGGTPVLTVLLAFVHRGSCIFGSRP